MNPIRKALRDKLKGDDKLTELAPGGVHNKQAPTGTQFPYIVFGKSSETNVRTFDGPTMDKDVWFVKGIGEAAKAEAIAERVRHLLDNSTLNIDGRVSQDVHRIGGIDYAETVDGERIDHVGHEYKIDSEETEDD